MKKIYNCLILCVLLIGCSVSPYQQGVEYANEYDACVGECIFAYEQVLEEFIDKIPGGYTSRNQVIEDYLKLQEECHAGFAKKWKEIETNVLETRKEMESASELYDFENGLANREHCAFLPVPDLKTIEISPMMKKRISQIIPPRPNEAQIVWDLVGHTLSEGKEKGYYPQYWNLKIEENSISDFKIIQIEEDTNSRFRILATMRLNTETRAYDAKVQISYMLEDIYDWKIEFVQSKGLDIVRTHRYDSCIKCYISKGLVWGALYAENNCEIALEVAGRELTYSGEWVTFSSIIPPHEKVKISNNDYDFVVDYVERP